MKNLKYFLVIAFTLLTAYLSYWVPASNVLTYTLCYGILFGIYFLLLKELTDEDVKWGLYAAIAIRLVVVPASNFTSNDIWRYLWDGNMQAIGYSPYTIVPKEVMDAGFNTFKGAGNLFHQVLSIRESSVYPPFMQIVFYCCIKASLGNQIIAIGLMKFIIAVAEIVSLSAILQLLQKFSLPAKNIFVYAFNPLVIVELVANAHFEALMICFLLVSWLYYLQNKNKRAVFFYTLSITTYILPIVFLPIILFRNNWKQNLKLLILLVFLSSLLGAIYFYGINVRYTYLSSLQLYFNQFEFNSSLFYWFNVLIPVRLQPTGGAILSRILIAIPLLVLVYWSWVYRQLSIEKLLPKILVFWLLFMALFTVMNPWYLAPIIMLSTFNKSYTALLWSALAIAGTIIIRQLDSNLFSHAINSIWLILLVVIFFWKDAKLLKS